jgi:C4-dicarboxylate transporter, DctM subunit
MDLLYVGIIGIILFLGLIAIRMPVAYAMAMVGTAGLTYIRGWESVFNYIPGLAFNHTSSFTLAALPLFILMGTLGFQADIARDSYDAALAWFGKVPGGLAIGTVYACAIFGACSGSSLAECAVFSKIAVPEMISRGYNKRLALGTVCSAGCLDVFIPPSIPFVLYGVLTEVSIGEMLIAGILPGIVYAVIMALAIGLFCYFKPSYAPKASGVNTSWQARWKSVKTLWAVAFLFALVLGSIYFGWATPDEAAGVGVFGTFLVVVYRKKFKWRDVMMATLDAGKSSAMIFLILGSASIFSGFILLTGVFSAISDWVLAQNLPLWGIFVALNLLWVVMDICLDGLSIMILTLPISIPIMQAHHIDLIWFGIVMSQMLMLGSVSPPFAMNCFVMKAALGDQVEMKDIFMGALPFCFLMLFILLVFYAFPEISLYLPKLMRASR